MAEPGGGEVPKIPRSEASKPSETRRIFDALKAGITGKIPPKEVFRQILNVTTETNLTAQSSPQAIETIASEPTIDLEKVLDSHEASVKRVDRFLEATKGGRISESFLQENLNEVNHGRERLHKLIGKNPISRMYAAKDRRDVITKLGRNGINNPEALVKTLEDIGSDLLLVSRDTRETVKDENGKKRRELVFVKYADYRELGRKGNLEKVIELNQKLGDSQKIGETIRNGTVLGLTGYQFEENLELLATLGKIPSKRLNEILGELKEFSCISRSDNCKTGEAKKKFGDLMIKFAEDPAYFQKVVDNLKDFERLYWVSGSVYDRVLLEDLDRGNADSQVLTVIGNMLTEDTSDINLDFRSTVHTLKINPESTREIIKLIDSGFTIDKETASQMSGYRFKEKLATKIRTATDILISDESGSRLVKYLTGFLGISDFDGLFHATEITDKIKTRLADGSADNSPDNTDVILSEIVTHLNNDKEFANRVFKGREDLLLSLAKKMDPARLGEVIKSTASTFSPESAIFWQFFSKHGNFKDFLLNHYQDFHRFFTKIDNKFVPTLACVKTMIVSNDSNCLDYLRDEFSSNQRMETLPVEEQIILATTIIQSSEYYKEVSNRAWPERAALLKKYMSDGRLNQQFFEDIACSNTTLAINLLTGHNLSLMSLEDRHFWSIFKKINPNIRRDFLDLKENFGQYVDNDGRLKAELFETLAKKGRLEAVNRALDLETISNFPEEKRKYWQLLINLKSVQAKEALLGIIEPLSQYAETGDTKLLIEQVNSLGIDEAGSLVGKSLQLDFLDIDQRYLTPIGLTGWNTYKEFLAQKQNEVGPLTAVDFEKIISISREKVIKRLKAIKSMELTVPEGLRVSLGIEIEVVKNGLARTGKITEDEIVEYNQACQQAGKRQSIFVEDFIKEIGQKIQDAKYLYRNQITLVDEMDVGRGNDATHEFANRPVQNYSLLLWELSELQHLGYINFDRKFLQHIEKGLHLTISAESGGIVLDENSTLLQNAILISGWGTSALDGIGAMEVVDVAADNSEKFYKQAKGFILERSGLKEEVFRDGTEKKGVENRTVGLVSFNHLARTLRSFQVLSVSLKAFQTYKKTFSRTRGREIVLFVRKKLDENRSLSEIMTDSTRLAPEFKDEKIKKLAILWAYFRENTTINFEEKQTSAGKYRLKSPLLEYGPRDMTRLGGELFKVFGGRKDDGGLEEDALKSYHKRPRKDSLPDIERQLIISCRREVIKILKN